MGRRLADFYQQPYCARLIETALRALEGKGWKLFLDDASYKTKVIDRAWESLPTAVKMFGRERLAWDDCLLELRKDLLNASEPKVVFKGDVKTKIGIVARRLFGDEEMGAGGVRRRKEVPEQAEVPLAKPVPPGRQVADPAPAARPSAPPAEEAAAESDVAVGIDLGTTYSVVAYLDAHGRPCSVANAAGDVLTPSVVLFDEGGPIVGKEAILAGAMEPDKVADVVKRDMGSKAYRKPINGEYLPPEVISSLILGSLKADAERRLGPCNKAVITVPAYFDESRRRATMDAGKMAGLDVLDIINEPTAAAIAYGYQLGFLDPRGRAVSAAPLRVLVFDLGGGTFDVTIMEIHGSSFRALATDGDVRLGGKDWDETLVVAAAEEFRRRYREDPRKNPVSRQDLGTSVEVAKKTLSERQRTSLYVNHLGSHLQVEFTREQFENLSAALLSRTRTTTEVVVRQAGLTWEDIDKVLLVGGATRMPAVVRMLEELSGKTPDRSVAADEAVAHGAALYANLLMQKRGRSALAAADTPQFSVTNVNSHGLGIVGVDKQTGRPRNQILIPKNTPLPHAVNREFQTFRPKQKSVVIRVVEGDSERPEACIQLGTCTIRNLPVDLPAGWPVQVNYSYDASGRLHVVGKLKGHRAGVVTDFHRDNSLQDEEVELWTQYVLEESTRLK